MNEIELGNGLPDVRTCEETKRSLQAAGFEVLEAEVSQLVQDSIDTTLSARSHPQKAARGHITSFKCPHVYPSTVLHVVCVSRIHVVIAKHAHMRSPHLHASKVWLGLIVAFVCHAGPGADSRHSLVVPNRPGPHWPGLCQG